MTTQCYVTISQKTSEVYRLFLDKNVNINTRQENNSNTPISFYRKLITDKQKRSDVRERGDFGEYIEL